MKKIEFREKKYNCPTSWDDVTLKMTIECSKLSDLLPDAPIIAIMSAYMGIPIKELTTAKPLEVQDIIDNLDFIYTPYEPQMINQFEFQGEKYYAETDIVNQPFGDWVSIQTILFNYKENPVEGLPRMIAVLCKKDQETLDTINVDERALIFEDLPITSAKNIECFFLTNLNAYKRISQLSSMEADMENIIRSQVKELRLLMKQRKADSGGFSLTRLWIGYYQIYLWYFENQLERYFNSTHSDISKKKWNPMLKKLYSKLTNKKTNK